jgi:hypothetical protein
MKDAALVHQVAAAYLYRCGSEMQKHCREKIDQALARDETILAEVWSDIAASAAEQMRPPVDPVASSQ